MPDSNINIHNVVVNRESQKIYMIVGNGLVGTTIQRLYDGTIYSLSDDIYVKYRPITPDEFGVLVHRHAEFMEARSIITADMLRTPRPRTGPEAPPIVPSPAPAPLAPADAGNASGEGVDFDENEPARVFPDETEELLNQNPRRGRGKKGGNEEPPIGILVEPDERFTMDRLIVPESVKREILSGLDLIEGRDILDREWGLSEISPMKGRCILNLTGPPGTGKTMAAKCIARKLGKPLYQVDYAEMISKWVGDTAKHIKSSFAEAKKNGAVLFYDEADSLLSRRITLGADSVSNSINQNRNVLMQELDRFDGVMITASNFFVNYDEALLRRISQHIHFPLPDAESRVKLFKLHVPNATLSKFVTPFSPRGLADMSDDFSGGDILVVCENAIKGAFSRCKQAMTTPSISQTDFEEAILVRRRVKDDHAAGRS